MALGSEGVENEIEVDQGQSGGCRFKNRSAKVTVFTKAQFAQRRVELELRDHSFFDEGVGAVKQRDSERMKVSHLRKGICKSKARPSLTFVDCYTQLTQGCAFG